MNGPKVQIGSKQFRLVEDGDDNNLKLLAEAETVFVEETSPGSQLPRDFYQFMTSRMASSFRLLKAFYMTRLTALIYQWTDTDIHCFFVVSIIHYYTGMSNGKFQEGI